MNRELALTIAPEVVELGFDVTLAGRAERGGERAFDTHLPETWTVLVRPGLGSGPISPGQLADMVEAVGRHGCTVYMHPTEPGFFVQEQA